MIKLKVFDGCTEFGSETQAFRDRGHDVTTLGIEGDVDIKIDIRDFHTTEHYDFMTLHPPCTEFSIAKSIKCKDRNPDMSIVDACFNLIKESNPTFWMIENPRGCMRYFIKKMYGLNPSYTIMYGDFGFISKKPTDLWGNLPLFYFYSPNDNLQELMKVTTGFSKESRKSRSLVPYGLSLALCKAIEATI